MSAIEQALDAEWEKPGNSVVKLSSRMTVVPGARALSRDDALPRRGQLGRLALRNAERTGRHA
jgi:hypothetical protein